jgi:hypothetical protein
MRKTPGLLLLTFLTLGPGCFYFGGDDDCAGDPDLGAPIAPLRNPFSGQCEAYGGGGGGGCGDVVPAYAEAADRAPVEYLDWAACYGFCEGLDETTCLATDACRGIYTETLADCLDCAPVREYVACWNTAPSGPVRGTGCSGYDAQECSRHDDCIAIHEDGGAAGLGYFSYCDVEPAGCDSDMEAPYARLRDPVTGQCTDIGGGGGGGCGEPGVPIAWPDWGYCDTYCEALDESSCKLADGCRAAYVDACPECDSLVLEFTGCWATAQTGPIRGGGCTGLDANECSRHDDCSPIHAGTICADGTLGCLGNFAWCQDEGTVVWECSTLTDEASCLATPTCEPVYVGTDCTCTPDTGCSCATWTFTSCQTQ